MFAIADSRSLIGRIRPSAPILVFTALAISQGDLLAQLPPDVGGAWSTVHDWQAQLSCTSPCGDASDISASALIPVGIHRGKVLFWRESCAGCGTSNHTTETYLFDPAAPGDLIKINHQVLPGDLFCAGFSWDLEGRLVVTGGNPATPTGAKKTYHFIPAALGDVINESATGRSVDGFGAWVSISDLYDARYYPSLCPLNRRDFGSGTPFAGGGHLVLGGTGYPVPTADPILVSDANGVSMCAIDQNQPYTSFDNRGVDRWQHMNPNVVPGIPVGWDSRVMYPLVGAAYGPPTAPAQPIAYDRLKQDGSSVPASNPDQDPYPKLETYPRVFQLADRGFDPLRQNQLFVANDMPAFANPPNPTNPSQSPNNPVGAAWLVRPPAGPFGWILQEATNSLADRFYGTAVLLHLRGKPNRILVFGGATNTATLPFLNWQINHAVQEYVIPPSGDAAYGTWITKNTGLNTSRMMAGAVLLPTGAVLIIGGGADVGSCDAGPGGAVFAPEIYKIGLADATGASTLDMNPSIGNPQVPRLYHSVSTLLADGRVLIAGGEDYPPAVYPPSGKNGEVFSPPYLFQSSPTLPRPMVLNGPSAADFSTATTPSTKMVSVMYSAPIHSVVLIRPSAVTHAFDIDQRYIELDYVQTPFASAGTSRFYVTMPTEDLGPPGWYMMFVNQDQGGGQLVPSVAWWVHIS